jgi:NADH-quinone oxidoreductase subunit J
MAIVFYIAGAIAIFATAMTITRVYAVHALLYLVISLIAVAVDFYAIGAPFVAALELVIYAGAIMVLFVFVVMMLNLGERAIAAERQLLSPGIWTGPSILAGVLIVELAWLIARADRAQPAAPIGPKQVAVSLFGPYLLGVELASMLLMAGLVGSYHLGWRKPPRSEVSDAVDFRRARLDAGGDLVRVGDGGDSRAP